MQSSDEESGRRANRNGKYFEEIVEQHIQKKGFVYWDKKGKKPEKWYSRQYQVGLNLVKRPTRADFILNGDIIIECKWQSSSGTVDEKLPFTMMNLIHIKKPSIMILDGGGCRPEMVDYLHGMSKGSQNVVLCNLRQFTNMNI